MGTEAPKQTTLYRFFDAEDRLLYVGISDRPSDRMSGHRRAAAWWDEASRCVMERFDTRAEAERAEGEAIRSEDPLFNVMGKPLPAAPEPVAKPTGPFPLTPEMVARVATGDVTFKELRMAVGLSIEHLAHAADLTLSTVARLERGRTTRPSRATVRALAAVIGISGEDLWRTLEHAA
jgi:DNA-binding XRE family transcriptional regulator